MTITLSSIANIAIDQMFRGLDGVLQKIAEDASARGVDEAVYLNTRLAPDMFPLAKQVQIATEAPLRMLARLAGSELPCLDDNETTIAALRERIVNVKSLLRDISTDGIDADPDAPITFPAGADSEMTLPRRIYLQNILLPNLYFHVTMTYAIARHLGVALGKMDYLAAPK